MEVSRWSSRLGVFSATSVSAFRIRRAPRYLLQKRVQVHASRKQSVPDDARNRRPRPLRGRGRVRGPPAGQSRGFVPSLRTARPRSKGCRARTRDLRQGRQSECRRPSCPRLSRRIRGEECLYVVAGGRGLPFDGRELGNAMLGPTRKQTEDVAEVDHGSTSQSEPIASLAREHEQRAALGIEREGIERTAHVLSQWGDALLDVLEHRRQSAALSSMPTRGASSRSSREAAQRYRRPAGSGPQDVPRGSPRSPDQHGAIGLATLSSWPCRSMISGKLCEPPARVPACTEKVSPRAGWSSK